MVLFRPVPIEDIVAAHQARAAAKAPAPPQVRNAAALVAIGEARPRRWRGHYYRVPRLSFSVGMELLVASQVLGSHNRVYSAGNNSHQVALRTARALLHGCVVVKRNPFRPISSTNSRRPWVNPFRKISASDARTLIDELLHVPDDTPQITSGTKKLSVINLLHGYMDFIREYPALVGSDGLPVSWAAYQYGVRDLNRIAAREALRAAQAVRIGQWHDKTSFERFQDQQERVAGWVH